MKRLLAFAGLSAVVGLGTCGCGGSSSLQTGSSTGATTQGGSYVGTIGFSDGTSGNIAFYVDSTGNITGRAIEGAPYVPETVTGTLQSSGSAQITVHIAKVNTSYAGTLQVTSGNTLTGNLVSTTNSSLTATINAPSIKNTAKFAGSYVGQFTTSAPPVTYTGSDSAIIDRNDNVTYLLDRIETYSGNPATNEVVYIFTGTITPAGVVNLTSSNSGPALTGTLTVNTANQHLVGTLSNADMSIPVDFTEDTQQ